MLSLDESRINSKIQASLGVQHIRVQIEQAEAELEKAHAALADLPRSVRFDMLSRQENALEALYQREVDLTAQARKTAERELQAERVESLRIEAAPLLERTAKNLEIMRSDLAKVARIEAEARTNGGRVMSDAFDKSSIEFFIPKLTLDPARGTWTFKR
jgi:hypothetical protein